MSQEEELATLEDSIKELGGEIYTAHKIGSDLENNPDRINLFKARLLRLDSTFDKFLECAKQANTIYKRIAKKKEIETLNSTKNKVKGVYYDTLAIDIGLKQKEQIQSSDILNRTINVNTSQSLNSTIKLPSINLPKFNGNISCWNSFKDTYFSLIHNNDELSSIQKYHYLKSSLKGTALQVIANIPLTTDNYTQAWEALQKKFDNKRLLATNYLTQILNFKPMTKCTLDSLEKVTSVALENIISFKNLKLQNESDFILLSLVLRLLDPKTREKFENDQQDLEIPSFQALVDFIHKQSTLLQSEVLTTVGNISNSDSSGTKETKSYKKHVFMSTGSDRRCGTDSSNVCHMCSSNRHKIYNCQDFLALEPYQRLKKIRSMRLCTNCFSSHLSSACESKGRCATCHKMHNSLLHLNNYTQGYKRNSTSSFNNKNQTGSDATVTEVKQIQGSSCNKDTQDTFVGLSSSEQEDHTVLLGTAWARIRDSQGNFQPLRVIIDSGSQRSFVTSSFAKRLGLQIYKNSQSLCGFGNTTIAGGKHQVTCSLVPMTSSSPECSTKAVVIPQIVSHMPTTPISSEIKQLFSHLHLADPSFNRPGAVDFLLGADLFGTILLGGTSNYQGNTVSSGPNAINTIFGWVLIGPIQTDKSNLSASLLTITDSPKLEELVQRFWEVDKVTTTPLQNPEDLQCERYFCDTHSRDQFGRYIIRLPFKDPQSIDLGDSYQMALHRFYKQEQRLNKNPSMKLAYTQVLQEYLDAGFMVPASKQGKFFLPHHCVLKDSVSTSLRVVFDASASTSKGSLNDKLLTGPKLQLSIVLVLSRFRTFQVAITADIKQMFLQIWVNHLDRPYQHLLYRFNLPDAIQEFELTRVIFGMSSSPYQALRVIKQLKEDEGSQHPLAASTIEDNIYIDDFLGGAKTVEQAVELQQDLVALLCKGGFELKKWSSSSAEVLARIPHENQLTPLSFSQMDDKSVKVLGLQWDPVRDCLSYAIQPVQSSPITKRSVLSTTARVYDPVGYLAPVIFKAKTIIQQSWSLKLGWDEDLPPSLASSWKRFLDQLPCLADIRISRCFLPPNIKSVQVVGFADASMLGYACAIYLRVIDTQDGIQSNLLISKTRLAPLKTQTIPRLELNAAVLLVRTLQSLGEFLSSLNVSTTYLLTDSTVVLGWLRTPPHTLKIYVGNRVAEVLNHSSVQQWHHVNSENNIADIASRGAYPSEIQSHHAWWHGPQWISQPTASWPLLQDVNSSDLPEIKPLTVLLSGTDDILYKLVRWTEQYSSLYKIQKLLAYIVRYFSNCRAGRKNINADPLSPVELHRGLRMAAHLVQRYYFKYEIKLLENQKIPNKLQVLSPFIDDRGTLRVGGRLANSPLPYESKHPVLLPSKCHLTNLIIDEYHLRCLHAGPQLLHSLIQRRFWIINARQVIRFRLQKCVTCLKLRPSLASNLMGDLPPSRFEQGQAFLNVGIDFAGPLLIKTSNRRKAPVDKAYISLFVCMSTKALHLELVSNLSTEAFMAALDRFIGRRGKPNNLFSDNGTNFVGANRQLRELYTWWKDKEVQRKLTSLIHQQEIQWSFNPPSAPHFGGLWEAGVKSIKTHLVRVVGKQTLTFEELYTVLIRIEAVVNSRPLCPNPSSANEFDILTPGHFLTGGPLLSMPEHVYKDTPMNRLSRWQLLTKFTQDIWNRWRIEYLNGLQQRRKWTYRKPNFNVNELVILKDPNAPPLHWPVGRILETFPGKDGVVRVVKLKTTKGEYTRPITTLVPLLPQQD